MPGTFYTRTGDQGYTGLLGEGRVAKEDLRVETLGTVDEASSALGVARAHSRVPESAEWLVQVQRDLYGMMAELAATPENVERFHTIDAQKVIWLESRVDELAALVKTPREFIVPGDSKAGAFFDLARTIIRRAERRVAELLHRGDLANPELLRYLNRLSSLCFLLEMREVQWNGGADVTLAKSGEEK